MWSELGLCCVVFGIIYQLYIHVKLNGKMENVSDVLKRQEELDKKLEVLDRKVRAGLLLDSKDQSDAISRLERQLQTHTSEIEDLEMWAVESDQKLQDLHGKITKTGRTLDAEDQDDTTLHLDKVELRTDQIKAQFQPASTYIRWGRTDCPGNGSSLVYHGVTGGSSRDNTGAAANHLCLPTEPSYGGYYEDMVQEGGTVSGAAYHFLHRNYNMKYFPGISASRDMHGQIAPCAVCHVARQSMIMVPAKNVCPDSWTVEYTGLLVSGWAHEKGASEYLCLDDRPEAARGIETYTDIKRLYLVESKCHNLPCPPYVDGRELTCAVCTK